MTTGAVASRFAADLEFAREIAERAGRILFERYERVERVDYKSARDVVTEVDHLSEALVIDAIRARFPGDGILAEESGAHTEAGGGRDRQPRASGGPGSSTPSTAPSTTRTGSRSSASRSALVVDGVPSVGVDPRPDARRDVRGRPSAGRPCSGGATVHASDKDKLGDCVVSLALGGRAVATRVRAIRKAIRVSRNMGSAALALAYVANGRFDAFIQSGGCRRGTSPRPA